jgi:hypothetical protein
VHFVGFVIGIYHDARSSECQNNFHYLIIALFVKSKFILQPNKRIYTPTPELGKGSLPQAFR